MIHVKRQTRIPDAFKSTAIKNDIRKYHSFYKRSASSRSQEGFNENVNGDTIETLKAVAEQFKYKCATCEISLNIRTVISDSWRPRQNAMDFDGKFSADHYWWLAYVWNNKYCLCPSCNKFKGTWFPVEGKRAPLKTSYSVMIKKEESLLVDPCIDYPEEHLLVDETGKLICLSKKGETTLEILKLNRQDLVAARKQVIHTTREHLAAIEKLWNLPKTKSRSLDQEKKALKKAHGLYAKLANWLSAHPEEDFIMVRRQITLTWMFLNPQYREKGKLNSLFPRSSRSVMLREINTHLTYFRQLMNPKGPAIPVNFKVQAILKPSTDYITSSLNKQDFEKFLKSGKKSIGKSNTQTPVSTIPQLLTKGLEIISNVTSNPITKTLASGAASLINQLTIESRPVRLYPERIEIRNFKSITQLEFDFKVPSPDNKVLGTSMTTHKEPWKFLLGENGVGKSSILQAIALVLAGDEYIKSMELSASELLTHGQKSGHVRIWFSGINEPATLTLTREKMTCNFETGKINVLAYGSTRVMPKENTSLQPESTLQKVKIKNLFDYSVSLSDVKKWLLSIDQSAFDQVARALKDVLDLPSVKTYFIRDNGRIYFSENHESLEQLSEGYRSVISLAVDIMKSLSDEPLKTSHKKSTSYLTYDAKEGIVLIDELSSHLHPRWQMRIVKALRKAFPKLQFIVTSHDPLSLKGIELGEVLLLKKNENDKIVGISNLPDPSALKAEQLLTSEFFGLSSTLDPELETQFNTYHHLLAKSKLTPAEQKQLDSLKDQLREKKHLGDSLREELMFNVIDQSLARYGNLPEKADRQQLFDDTREEVLKVWDELYKK